MAKGNDVETNRTSRDSRGGSRSPSTNYKDLDRLETAEGLVAIISMRRSTGVITFSIFKQYERDGVMEKSTFVPETLMAAYIDLAQLVQKRIKEIRAAGTHMGD